MEQEKILMEAALAFGTIIWMFGALVWIIGAVVLAMNADYKSDLRIAARMFLATPIYPFIILYFAFKYAFLPNGEDDDMDDEDKAEKPNKTVSRARPRRSR